MAPEKPRKTVDKSNFDDDLGDDFLSSWKPTKSPAAAALDFDDDDDGGGCGGGQPASKKRKSSFDLGKMDIDFDFDGGFKALENFDVDMQFPSANGCSQEKHTDKANIKKGNFNTKFSFNFNGFDDLDLDDALKNKDHDKLNPSKKGKTDSSMSSLGSQIHKGTQLFDDFDKTDSESSSLPHVGSVIKKGGSTDRKLKLSPCISGADVSQPSSSKISPQDFQQDQAPFDLNKSGLQLERKDNNLGEAIKLDRKWEHETAIPRQASDMDQAVDDTCSMEQVHSTQRSHPKMSSVNDQVQASSIIDHGMERTVKDLLVEKLDVGVKISKHSKFFPLLDGRNIKDKGLVDSTMTSPKHVEARVDESARRILKGKEHVKASITALKHVEARNCEEEASRKSVRGEELVSSSFTSPKHVGARPFVEENAKKSSKDREHGISSRTSPKMEATNCQDVQMTDNQMEGARLVLKNAEMPVNQTEDISLASKSSSTTPCRTVLKDATETTCQVNNLSFSEGNSKDGQNLQANDLSDALKSRETINDIQDSKVREVASSNTNTKLHTTKVEQEDITQPMHAKSSSSETAESGSSAKGHLLRGASHVQKENSCEVPLTTASGKKMPQSLFERSAKRNFSGLQRLTECHTSFRTDTSHTGNNKISVLNESEKLNSLQQTSATRHTPLSPINGYPKDSATCPRSTMGQKPWLLTGQNSLMTTGKTSRQPVLSSLNWKKETKLKSQEKEGFLPKLKSLVTPSHDNAVNLQGSLLGGSTKLSKVKTPKDHIQATPLKATKKLASTSLFGRLKNLAEEPPSSIATHRTVPVSSLVTNRDKTRTLLRESGEKAVKNDAEAYYLEARTEPPKLMEVQDNTGLCEMEMEKEKTKGHSHGQEEMELIQNDLSLMKLEFTDSNGIKGKSDSYEVQLLQLLKMLKEKHEEAMDLRVKALVNNNTILMLSNPIDDEKIQSITDFVRTKFSSLRKFQQ